VPEWLKELRLRLKTLISRRQLERDLEDEMAFHLDMREQKLRDAGTSDVRASARRGFGNLTRLKEDCRELWTFGVFERLWSDLRIAMRYIVKSRWAMAAVILSLSLGIGSTAAVFNLFDAILFRPLPVPETERVVRIASVSHSASYGISVSNPDFEDLRRRTQSVEVATYSPGQLPQIMTRSGQKPRGAFAILVSAEFFSGLGFKPVLGRSFRLEEDEVPGRDAVAIISSGLWVREYGGTSDVLGKSIWINSKEFSIVGVAPRSIDDINVFGKPEVYLPRMMEGLFGNEVTLTDRTSRRLQLFARLEDGITIERARDEVGRIASELEQEYPDTNRGKRMAVYTQFDFKIANSPESFIAAGLFFAIAGLVLLIACTNIGNLLLSTAPARTREMSIRVTMGASRARLVRQMVIETAIVSVVGTIAGLGIAALAARFITSIELFANTPFKLDVHVDTRVALFALAIGILAGILSGLVPAIRCSHANLNMLLKSADSHISQPGRMRIRQILVVMQVTVAVVVLVVCGFSLQQLRVMRTVNPGFQVDGVLRVPLGSVFNTQKSYRDSLERVRALPGIRAAAAAYPEPLGVGNEATNLVVDGFTLPENESSVAIGTAVVSDGYFEALAIPILRGRAFDIRDTGEGTQVAIINEAMAQKYWPDRDALGGRIKTVGASLAGGHALSLEVVGIARTARYHSLSEAPTPFLYLPLKQTAGSIATLFAVTDADPVSFAATLRREFNAFESNDGMYKVDTMSRHIRHGALVIERLTAQIMTGVSVIGLLLSVIGLYAIVAYSISRRTHEIGIRMAIGATSAGVLRQVLAEGMKLSVAGIVFGVTIAAAVNSLLGVFFQPADSSHPDPNSPLVYVAVVLVSLGVTGFACFLPARRASMVDPNVALKSE
jgi:predicted permease